MKNKSIILFFIFFCITSIYSAILMPHNDGYYLQTLKVDKDLLEKNYSMDEVFTLTRSDFIENIQESLAISYVFDEFCYNADVANLSHLYLKQEERDRIFANIQFDNSLFFLRLGYDFIGIYDDDEYIINIIDRIEKSSCFERSVLMSNLDHIYLPNYSQQTIDKMLNTILHLWKTSNINSDWNFLRLPYLNIRNLIGGTYDNTLSKHGEKIYKGEKQCPNAPYLDFVSVAAHYGRVKLCSDFSPHHIITKNVTIKNQNENNIKHTLAYHNLLEEKQILDADFTFFWLRNVYNKLAIDLARQHIQNQDFKDARYKTVYYLVNHDFDYSFPILTKMVQDGSLHINEKKNFYRGLARLNKLPYSVLTKDQQQKANDYLSQQMHNEQDISIKLYIDFLLSICVDEYGLSNERTSFLNSLKEIGNLSQEDIAQIDRRLKIIKYSIYTHSPSIFDSYVNGLTTEKPFIDVSKVDIHMLPVYEAEANGETWYYHDVNSEAYIATNTNKYKSLNLTIPQKLGIFPVVGITEGAFGSSWHSYTNIVIPKSVTYISYQAFAYNTNLLSIAIPNTVTNIGYSAFKRSNNISTIFLEEGSIFEDKHLYNDRDLTPDCKIIRTKFKNGLPIVPPKSENNN